MVERYIKDSGAAIAKWVLLIIFTALFLLDLFLVAAGRTQAIDMAVQGAVLGLREEALTTIFGVITFFGNPLTMIALCVFIVILPSRMKIGLPVALMTAIGWFAHTLLKSVVARPRPDMEYWLVNESGYSFPSGHANASMIFWVALLILVGRVLVLQYNSFAAVLLRIVFFIFAALIGLSRIYLGVHYCSDVFGGWMLACIILILSFALYENLWPSKWRVTYFNPEWDAIPRNAEKKRAWRKPSRRRAQHEPVKFPKNRSPWKIPPPSS